MGLDRRSYLRVATGSTTLALTTLAGCATRESEPEPQEPDGDDEPDEPKDEGVLRVATTDAFAHGENPASAWLKTQFEETFDNVEVNWVIPESGIGHYVEREQRGFLPDVDAYVGLSAADLATVDHNLEEGGLFRELNRDRIETLDGVLDGLDIEDPDGRIVPVSTQYSCLMVDETRIDPPTQLEELGEPAYADSLLTPTPSRGRGGAFLDWLFESVGPDDTLALWAELEDNGLDVYDTWVETLLAYAERTRPMTVAYAADALAAIDRAVTSDTDETRGSEQNETDGPDNATDETGADGQGATDSGTDDDANESGADDGSDADGGGSNGEDSSADDDSGDDSNADDPDDESADEATDIGGDPDQYQVTYLDGEAYAEPLQMAIFENAINVDLAYTFLEFALSPEIQAGLAPRLGQYPVHPIAELEFPEEFGVYADHAEDPPSVVTFSYETRRDDLPAWRGAWEEEFGY
ncbi:ABC transporter substrate-binding protein [Natronosalvus rutilus]|uniref:ABC transporter substrate-binding protein n=1 Tax=Natronosalvus rutilus TaxID=2953753 RepID=A0A9E7NBA8_9EURY|nr:ABC transporter substrate-binding protein [Natronosalvus rutilus]UTF54286.1 ABC transporter substrate-binding protein [Natronosalvus rutilus]